jgi:ubiquinone/menaquinone biosynthesis C-methylase UbiE
MSSFALPRRFGPLRGLAAIIGQLALATVALLFAVQIVVRLLYRVVPVRGLRRLAYALDEPIRRRFLKPIVLARRVGLRSGMRVLHLDPGDGPTTEALARIVGLHGRIEAMALDAERLQHARAYLTTAGTENASVMPSDGSHIPFEDQSFDAVCVVSSLGRVPDAPRLLGELRRVLRPAGRCSISDVVSDPSYLFQKTLIRLGEASGLELLEHFGDTVAYTVNFRKPFELAPD